MVFTRTKSGLSNLAMFYGVDLIIFTEGGQKSFTYEQVMNGEHNEWSVDIKFWNSVFLKHKLNKKIQFRALGSKTSSKEICEKIVENEIKNVVVARDADLDVVMNNKLESPYILYTRGYSWENDVYHQDLVKEVISTLVLRSTIPDEYFKIIEQTYNNFDKLASRIFLLEIIFRMNNSRLITDCNGERFINGKSRPKLKIHQILDLVDQRKNQLKRPVRIPREYINACPIRYCYGKLREALALAVISYICGKICGIKSLPKEILVATMIEHYRNRNDHFEDMYYEQIVRGLNAL